MNVNHNTLDRAAEAVRRHTLNPEAVAFFCDHASFSYDPANETPAQGQQRCAEQLAHAEAEATRRGWVYKVEEDPDAWSDLSGIETPELFSPYLVSLNDYAETLGAVWISADNDPETDDYIRVVKAELADTHLWTLSH